LAIVSLRFALLVSLAASSAGCLDKLGTGTTSSEESSHFHVNVNGSDERIDCSVFDHEQDFGTDAAGTDTKIVGLAHQSGQQFFVTVPDAAAGFHSPGVLGRHAVAALDDGQVADHDLFALSLAVNDGKTAFYVCGVDQCGAVAADTSQYYHEVTSITEVDHGTWTFPSKQTVPTVTYRISGSFRALMRNYRDTSKSPPTVVATGDWSLLVSVVDSSP
jgi:hypothetical protein